MNQFVATQDASEEAQKSLLYALRCLRESSCLVQQQLPPILSEGATEGDGEAVEVIIALVHDDGLGSDGAAPAAEVDDDDDDDPATEANNKGAADRDDDNNNKDNNNNNNAISYI